LVKKLLKLATVFTLLLGCYFGYVRAFTVVVGRLTAARRVEDVAFRVLDSRSKKEAIAQARQHFGPDHWTAREDLQLRYYNAERGFWMYSQKEERVIEEDGVRYDGRRIKLKPVAIIWRAKDGSSTKTITAEEALIDFNQPLSFNVKPGAEPMVVKYARLERDVLIRDDRGTVLDRGDDMVIGPLTWVEYDDNSLQVRSDSHVVIVDRDTTVSGDGMLIQLRPKSEPVAGGPRPAGFEGARSARLNQNVEVIFSDVGKTGILPGKPDVERQGPGKVAARVEVKAAGAAAKGSTGAQAAEPVPLNLRCEGHMQVDLPRPHLPVKVGPPAPPAPTLVHFERNVVVRRGKLSELPDQLDCDNLDLVLVQAEKPAPRPGGSRAMNSETEPAAGQAETSAADEDAQPQTGMLGNQTLQRVHATGHAVWLQLPAEGAKIRCNELIHKVAPPDGGEGLTYFRGDATRKLMVEKHDYEVESPAKDGSPARRKLQSITRIWAIDATLVDSGGGMESSNLFAHGPGLLETRPAPGPADRPDQDVPPDRTVVWQDRLVVKNVLGPDKKLTGREMILKGSPRVVDRLQQASLDAADTIVAWLEPRPEGADQGRPAGRGAEAGRGGPQAGGFRIKRLLALRDVHLVAPSKRLTARDRLDADFEEAPSPVIAASSPAQGAAGAPAAPEAAAAPAPGAADGQAGPKEKPPEPSMVALANHVKAKVLIDPAQGDGAAAKNPSGPRVAASGSAPAGGDADSNYQIRDLLMFGNVSLHQDPSPGKTKGQDATGEALVLRNEGPGRAIFNIYNHDPRAKKPPAGTSGRLPRARVITEDMNVEGDIIGVNQITDQAWVYGPGKLVQLTERSLLTDRAEGEDAPSPGGAAEGRQKSTVRVRTRAGKVQSDRVPLVVTWGEKMLFHGRSLDPENRPAAKAQFFKNARAEMEDGLLYCDDVMTTYTDRPIPLAEVGKLSQAGAGGKKEGSRGEGQDAEQPKPDLASIDLVGRAQAISRKVAPDRPVLLSRQRITGDRLIYDRRTGDFQVPGAGIVYLYDREDSTRVEAVPGRPRPPAGQRNIRATSGRTSDKDKDKDRAGDRAGKKALPDLVLTQIHFSREMKGRFGTGKAGDKTETRWADFFGDIEAARAVVPNERTIIDYDRLPADAYFLTSQTMRVVTEPPPPGSPAEAPSRNYLKAWENAYARTDDTAIQADIITYDSSKDLIYANGQEGRLVQIVQQKGVGQPGSPTRAQSVRVNPRTGAVDVSDPRELQLVEAKTGTRPKPQAPPDPNAKPPKPVKPPYRPPLNNIERKGFTGR
jgi:lipopolysaccharide export system protein LptA